VHANDTRWPISSTRRIPWPRVLLEGVVIVVSILLAFGIDAWWDGRANRQQTWEHLEAVRYELQENRELLDEQAESCAGFRSATDGLLSLMGPRPTVVPADSIVWLLGQAMYGGIGNRLSTTALDAMIAKGSSPRSSRLNSDASWEVGCPPAWISVSNSVRTHECSFERPGPICRPCCPTPG
jgi:hypothetical protein